MVSTRACGALSQGSNPCRHPMKKILFIFIFSFILNLIWENLHSLLYANYIGGKITEFVLFHASLGDAVMITLVLLPFVFYPKLKKYNWMIIIIFLIVAILIEYYALGAGRWAYNSLMPIIPIFGGIGLTPMIQLGLLGYLTFKLEEYFF
jgi:hypothetical protein